MRKIVLLILLPILMLVLVACEDKKLDDNANNVVFYVGVGSSYIDTYFDVPIGEKIEAPEEPIRTGFDFVNWYKDIKHTKLWDFDNDVVNESIVLYAKWESQYWTLEFVLNEILSEEYVDPSNIPTGFNLTTNIYLPVLRRPGGSFRGWILVPSEEYTLDMKIYRYSNELPIEKTKEFVLYPVFNNNKYLIQFAPRMTGVTVPAPKTNVEYGSIIDWIKPLADTETHRFIGWFSKNGSSGDWGIEIVNGDYYIFPNNSLLYAKWEEK